METKLIIIIAFSYLYGIFEAVMSLMQRRRAKVSKSGDKGSVWVIYLVIAIGCTGSFLIGSTETGRIYHWDTFFAIGGILVILGLIIRIRSILILKKHFTYSVALIENHELIQTGLYGVIRHPGYLGQLIIFMGIATTLSNWLSIIFMMLPVLIGYIYRINVEEKFLIEQMGTKYLEYQKRTDRLIPKVY